jgi:hypothetical protein
MMFSSENTDKQVGRLTEYRESFRPIDRKEFSETALSLIDRYRIDNANDPVAAFIAIVDQMNAKQREAVSQFEAATALASVEFGRIDLAIGRPRKPKNGSRRSSMLWIECRRISRWLRIRSESGASSI